MSHTAELIAVGTELLLGDIANTNARTPDINFFIMSSPFY